MNEISFLAELPADWPLVRADAVLELSHYNKKIEDFDDEDIFHYSIPSIQEIGDGRIENTRDIKSDKLALRGGELIVSKLNPHKGCVFLTEPKDLPILCSSEFVPLNVKIGFLARFAYYLYSSEPVREEISSKVQSATRSHQRVNPTDIVKIWIPNPSEDTQKAIVSLLDQESASIDELVAAKLRLLEILNEKRRTVVAEAVMRGLDRSAPLRPSGIDWLGDIPAHWEIERSRWLFAERDERSETGEEEMLTVSHITGVTPRSEKDVNMFEAETTAGYKLCFTGDLVINTLWAWMGAMGTAPVDGIVSPAYNVYTPGQRLLPAYVDALVRIPVFAQEVTRYSKGVWSSRLRLYPEGFFETFWPVPPLDEQKQIVAHIAEERVKIDKLATATERSIGLLRERRSALIAAAVTGQIDIPEAA